MQGQGQMVKPPSDHTARLTRAILKDERIDRVDISVRERGVIAYAIPSSFHPAVAERRDHAFAKAGGSVTIEQATAINAEARDSPVAHGRGRTILEAWKFSPWR